MSTSLPLISIVIPTFNHANYLGKALQSIEEQTYTNWEIIVVDNHSTDHTDEVIKQFSHLNMQHIKIHNDGIIAVSRNKGIKEAKGEWVAFLDSDDWWAPEKLTTCQTYINEHTDLIYHNLKVITQGKKNIFTQKTMRSRQVKKPALIDLLTKGNTIANSSVLVRKKLLVDINYISEERKMIAAEDYHTWLKIAQRTDQFIHIPKSLGFYLQHQNNLSNKDMSKPVESAIQPFLSCISAKQKAQATAIIHYMQGQYALTHNGNKSEILQNLFFSFKNGRVKTSLKSLFYLLKLRFQAYHFLNIKD